MPKPIKGMDELIRKLDTIAKLKGAKRGLKAGAEHIEGVMKEYAPKSQANVPKAHGRWYERGWGSKYRRIMRPMQNMSMTQKSRQDFTAIGAGKPTNRC
jgi:hypothetical protein